MSLKNLCRKNGATEIPTARRTFGSAVRSKPSCPIIDIEAILTTAATVVVIGATLVISGPILGAAYVLGGFALSEGINYLADTYIGPGWGNIINGTLGFLALGLGAVFSRRATIRNNRPGRVAAGETPRTSGLGNRSASTAPEGVTNFET